MPATRSTTNNTDGLAFEAVAVTLEVSKGVQKTIVRDTLNVRTRMMMREIAAHLIIVKTVVLAATDVRVLSFVTRLL